MERDRVFEHLDTVCRQLDQADRSPDTSLYVSRLYLFGSVLTDKSEPTDIDLIIEPHPELAGDAGWLSDVFLDDEVGVFDQMVQQQGSAVSLVSASEPDPQAALAPRVLRSGRAPCRLIWEPGFNWLEALGEVHEEPLPRDRKQEKLFRTEQDFLMHFWQHRDDISKSLYLAAPGCIRRSWLNLAADAWQGRSSKRSVRAMFDNWAEQVNEIDPGDRRVYAQIVQKSRAFLEEAV